MLVSVPPRAGCFFGLLVVVGFAFACDQPCRSDNDCPTVEGLQRCERDTGLCVPLSRTSPQECNVDDNCTDGRSCVQQECVFRPACQRFLAPGNLPLELNCANSGFVQAAGVLSTLAGEDCATLLAIPGLDENIALGRIEIDLNAAVAAAPTSDCSGGGVFDATTGALALEGCALVALGDTCDIGFVARPGATGCIIGGDACGAAGNCTVLATTGGLVMGRCE